METLKKNFKKSFIELSIYNDDEQNALTQLKITDGQEFWLTVSEILELKEILDENFKEITKCYNEIQG